MPLYAQARRAVSGAAHLAQVQAVPHDHPPVRLPTFPAIESTSVIKFTANTTVNVDARNTYCMVIRSPTCQLWTSAKSTTTPGSAYYEYVFSGSSPTLPDSAGETLDLSSLFLADTSYTQNFVGSGSDSFGAYPLAIDDSNRVWCYAPSPWFLGLEIETNVIFPAGSWTVTCEVSPDLSGQNTELRTFTAGYSGNKLQFYSTCSAWWIRFVSLNCTATVGASATTIHVIRFGATSGNTGTFANPTMAQTFDGQWWKAATTQNEFSRASLIWENTRCNALGILFQNVTAVLNKEGTVTAYRTPTSGSAAFSSVGNPLTTFSANASVVTASQRYFGMLEKGLYLFAPPDTASSNFKDYTITTDGGGSTQIPAIRMGCPGYTQFVEFCDLGNTAVSSTLAVTLDYMLEFRNSTALWPIDVTRTSLEEWHAAQVSLAKMECFFENPTHLSKIAALAAAAARWAAPRVASYVSPMVGPALIKGGAALVDMAYAGMKARKTKSSQPKRKAKKAGPTLVNKPQVRVGK